VYDRYDSSVKPYELFEWGFHGYDGSKVSDDFGDFEPPSPHSPCTLTKNLRPENGQMLLDERIPNTPYQEGQAAYCYQFALVTLKDSLITSKAAKGEAFHPASQNAMRKWSPIIKQLIPFIEQEAGQVHSPAKQTRTRHIVADKAQLFLTPDPADLSKMYLVKGDEVETLDSEKDGWCFVRYITNSQKLIEKWVQIRDLDSPPYRKPSS
jgi:hypothetical protein